MWRKRIPLRLLAILLLVVLSATVISGISAQDDSPTDQPTATDVPTNTPQPTATNTPQPTATNTPQPTATNTPQPSATAQPTNTTAPTATNTPQPTATNTPQPSGSSGSGDDGGASAEGSLTVSKSEPSKVTAGQGGTLSISGAGFTSNTTVRLVGFGYLTTTLINSKALTAAIPTSLSRGTYSVEVSDPANGTATSPNQLKVSAPDATDEPTTVKTAVPGQATLAVNGFTASPTSIYPGQTTVLTMSIVNVGNRSAKGGTVSLGTTTFAPANGQGSVTLPDLGPGASTSISFAITAPKDAAEGPASIPLVLASRDSEGNAYSDSATVSVIVLAALAKQPQLVLNGYQVTPSSAQPGDTVTVQAVLVNTGTDTASQVLFQLDTTTAVLIPAESGNSLAIGDMAPGASVPIQMTFTVSADAEEGARAQNFNVSYLYNGDTQTTSVSVTLNVKSKPATLSQIVVDSYQVSPSSAYPGDTVMVEAVLRNSGTDTAGQVLLQLDTTTSLLIPSTSGSSYAIGDMAAGTTAKVSIPLTIASDASAGMQAQPFKISYLQGDTAEEASAAISLNVLAADTKAPLLVLQAYDDGQTDPLLLGQEFTYSMTIDNAGNDVAKNVVAVYGATTSSSSSSTNSATTTTTSTTTSTDFAIVGSGGTVVIGDMAAGASKTLTQKFIVSNSLTSGVQTLPILLQYQLADGTTKQQALTSNLLVVIPPTLRVTQTTTLTDPLTVGQNYNLSFKLANLGADDATTTRMRVSGENVEVTTGAETLLDPLQSDDDVTETATIRPTAAGDYTITVDVDYVDALNRTQTYTTTFTGTVEAVATNTRANFTPPTITQTETTEDTAGRLLLGFLGFGG